MDGILLQTVEGLGSDPAIRPSYEIWEWLQDEKAVVASEILAEGPLCHSSGSGVQEAEASEECGREIEWHHRGELEARLRNINDAMDRLMDGAYGRCTDCGAAIGNKRLGADPTSALCFTCQKGAEVERRFCTL